MEASADRSAKEPLQRSIATAARSAAPSPPSCRSPRCCHSPARVRIAARHLRSFAFICGWFLGTAFPEAKPQMNANERKWKRPQTGRRRNRCSDRSQRRHGARRHRPRRAAVPVAAIRQRAFGSLRGICVHLRSFAVGSSAPPFPRQNRKWTQMNANGSVRRSVGEGTVAAIDRNGGAERGAIALVCRRPPVVPQSPLMPFASARSDRCAASAFICVHLRLVPGHRLSRGKTANERK